MYALGFEGKSEEKKNYKKNKLWLTILQIFWIAAGIKCGV